MRCQKRFNILKFQNIILSVADSGVIERITFKSVIIYDRKLLRLIWMSAISAILKMSKPRGFLEKSIKFFAILTRKPVQITFLANLTGILVFLTYNPAYLAKNEVSFFEKSPI